MIRYVSLLLAVSAVFLVALPGCKNTPLPWEITVENKSEMSCSFFITYGPGSNLVKVEDVAKGKTISLIVGDSKAVVESVRVVRGTDEQTLTPKTELLVGKRYAIVVGADGKVETSVSDK